MDTKYPYQIEIVVGNSAEDVLSERVVNLTPTELTSENILETITKTDLTSADMRAKVVVTIGDAPDGLTVPWANTVAATYASLLGFGRRRLDLRYKNSPVMVMSDIDISFRKKTDNGRPNELPELVTVGNVAVTGEDVTHINIDDLTEETIGTLRWARRVLWSPENDVTTSLVQLVALAGIRARGEADRLPAMWTADEENGNVLDLSNLRRNAELLRAAGRAEERSALAVSEPLTERQQYLADAGNTDIVNVLTKLGAKSATIIDNQTEEEITVWHCLYPQNHTNGDATPSARIGPIPGGGQGFRCLRCLPERVDTLRLVMWAKNVSADEAADLITSWK